MDDYWTTGEGVMVASVAVVLAGIVLYQLGRAVETVRRLIFEAHMQAEREDEWKD